MHLMPSCIDKSGFLVHEAALPKMFMFIINMYLMPCNKTIKAAISPRVHFTCNIYGFTLLFPIILLILFRNTKCNRNEKKKSQEKKIKYGKGSRYL